MCVCVFVFVFLLLFVLLSTCVLCMNILSNLSGSRHPRYLKLLVRSVTSSLKETAEVHFLLPVDIIAVRTHRFYVAHRGRNSSLVVCWARCPA